MKKRIFTLLLVCILTLTACNQTENPNETTETTETTQTTETTKTTVTSQTTETTRPTVKTEIVRAKPLQEENPELQEKIDRNQKRDMNDIAYKVILTIGTQTDVPYAAFGESEWLTEWMYSDDAIKRSDAWYGGWWYNRAHSWDRTCYDEAFINRLEEFLPVYLVNGEETFTISANDTLVERPIEILIDGENGNYRQFQTINEMCNDLASGRYYARIQVTCYGDTLYVDGHKEFTEWLGAYYFFIIEIL